MCAVCLTLNSVPLSERLAKMRVLPIHSICMPTPSCAQTCEVEPVENDVCPVQDDCGLLEVDIQQHLVLGSTEASAGTECSVMADFWTLPMSI
jgi:hypothetical protein